MEIFRHKVSGRSFSGGRIAWFQVYGIPAQLALDGVFDLIGSRFGKVVQSASLSGDDNNFSYALIGVLSKECKRIADRVDINWRGRIFKVWVDEDLGEWMPECVAEDEEDDGSVLPEEDKCHDNIVQDDVNTVNREEGECSQANDVSVGDFDGNGLDGCANDIPNEVVSEPSNVHDFSNEVLVENDNVDNISAPVLKGTGRKKFRRKSLVTNRSGGSGSSERPKKRPRENNDMFDIDRLIGVLHVPAEVSRGNESGDEGVFLTPDLNKGLSSNTAVASNIEEEALEPSMTCSAVDPLQHQGPIDVELEKTTELSKVLGVGICKILFLMLKRFLFPKVIK
ncbi:hypothetical protein HanIR_Chr03g0109631 [Helianthus annuus]|nr:hypothetical protein HanIR_Chr03g0109631 [Helianthus annuus]